MYNTKALQIEIRLRSNGITFVRADQILPGWDFDVGGYNFNVSIDHDNCVIVDSFKFTRLEQLNRIIKILSTIYEVLS